MEPNDACNENTLMGPGACGCLCGTSERCTLFPIDQSVPPIPDVYEAQQKERVGTADGNHPDK